VQVELIEIELLQRTWAVLDDDDGDVRVEQRDEAFVVDVLVVTASSLVVVLVVVAVVVIAWRSFWERRLLVVRELLPLELDWSFLVPWCYQHPSIPCRWHA